ncbi:MAG: FKBP-type peptidyl-prolyl cis-trans isomerase [Bacteroidales bacterium]|nr:FKBP-type peptidyl-prolyl cis-trans isomerase [Bacteroidales bacterium]
MLLPLMAFIACSEDSTDYDPYYNWKSRNADWYKHVADSARTAIAQAKAAHGDDWEQYCEWRMYKSLLRSPSYQSGNLEDSICVHIVSRGDGNVMPMSTDSVYINFRGTLMPTTDADGNVVETIFSQTYYGTFDPATAAPQLSVVNAFTEGFQTALQYMVKGDDWNVYIPQELFYGGSAQGIIPAYSAACFRINLTKVIVTGASS